METLSKKNAGIVYIHQVYIKTRSIFKIEKKDMQKLMKYNSNSKCENGSNETLFEMWQR